MAKSKFEDAYKYLLDPSKKASNEKEFFQLFIDKGIAFFSGELRKNKVVRYKSPKELRGLLDENIPQNPISKRQLSRLLDLVGKYSILQADKKYLAFPDGGNSKYAIGGSIYAQFLNQNQISLDRGAPIGTIIEIQLINWLRKLLGYKTLPLKKIDMLSKVGGMWTPGGNLSNYISILAALNKKFPDVKEHGIASLDKKPVIIMAGGIEHYSYKSACSWLGLGSDSIIWADPGINYTSSVQNFRKAIKEIGKDKIPFYVVAIAGNCRTSGLDNIEEVASFCKEYGLWFHVDACHGGSFLFSKKYKKLIKGIENADSVSLDPHKSLFIPYSSSYVLFKDPKIMNIFSRYPEKADAKDYLDLGLITPFLGSRGFESLKFWLMIKGTGMKALGKLIEHRQELSSFWFSLLKNNNNVVVLNELDFYRISFVIFPKARLKEVWNMENKEALTLLINKYTKLISDKIYKNGDVCMDEFKLKDFNRKITSNSNMCFTVIGTTIGNSSSDNESLVFSNEILSKEIENIIKKYNSELDELIYHNRVTKNGSPSNMSNGPAGWN